MTTNFGTGGEAARARTPGAPLRSLRACWPASPSGAYRARVSCALPAGFVAALPSRSRHPVPRPLENPPFLILPGVVAREPIPPIQAARMWSKCYFLTIQGQRFLRRVSLPARDRRNYRVAAASRPATAATWFRTRDSPQRATVSANLTEFGRPAVALMTTVFPLPRLGRRPS